MIYPIIILILLALLSRKIVVKIAKKNIKDHEYKKWKNEVRKRLYDLGYDNEVVSSVVTKEEYWSMLFEDEVPPELAIIIAGLEAGERNEEILGV